ncbi:MAG: asparagine synthase (glutamine-hydrolyzing), partial [Candidatus Rokubacteria bacterium]|nr:asparagine synthase (glutamine-hydrolyzing) [Candidatus Rokubacteria bacterium]
ALAHRRLMVIDPSPAAGQPMRSTDGRFTLVYNGELYNDAELRADLARVGGADRGPEFRTSSDTETLLAALERRGGDAVARLRGMYAFALYDAREKTILAARDPLGIKPLYYWLGRSRGGPLLILASEIPAILSHPEVTRRPDPVGVSTYLTTIRTALGERTLFEGVRAIRPGRVLRFDLSGDGIRVTDVTPPSRPRTGFVPGENAAAQVRSAVEDSVRRHLRSDVPICCLLSGGLDSTIVATIARQAVGELFTYCAGAPTEGSALRTQDDFALARLVASRLGTRHAEAPVTRALFGENWSEMIRAQGVPLSTPNEVAIHEVARRLRADGKIVTISGEGADELFAGYEAPMAEALKFERALAGEPGTPAAEGVLTPRRARFQLDSNAWVPLAAKPALLAAPVWKTLESDDALIDTYEREFAAA